MNFVYDMKKPQLNFKKLQRLEKLSPSEIFWGDFFLDATNELHLILMKLKSEHQSEYIISQKNYFIIRLVTFLESFFADTVSKLIDVYKLPIKNLFNEPFIQLPLSHLDYIKKDKITEGKIVASSFNFQNKSEINEVLSGLIGVDFHSALKNFEIKKNFENRFIENWDLFFEIFQVRHEIVHNFKYRIKYTSKDLDEIIQAFTMFIATVSIIIGNQIFESKSKIMEKVDPRLFTYIKAKRV